MKKSILIFFKYPIILYISLRFNCDYQQAKATYDFYKSFN